MELTIGEFMFDFMLYCFRNLNVTCVFVVEDSLMRVDSAFSFTSPATPKLH